MHILDLSVLLIGAAITLFVFVQKTNIEKSRVPVRIRKNTIK